MSSFPVLRSHNRYIAIALAFMVSLGTLLYAVGSEEVDGFIAVNVAVAVFGVSVALVTFSTSGGLLSPAGCYLLLLGLFHLGTAFAFVHRIGEPRDLNGLIDRDWLHSPALGRSLALSALAFSCFATGTVLSSHRGGRRDAILPMPPSPSCSSFFYSGLFIVFTGTLLMWIDSLRTDMMRHSYSYFYENAAEGTYRLFGYGNRLFLIGIILSAVGCSPDRMIYLFVLAIACYGPFFLFGFRGHLIVYMASFMIIWSKKNGPVARKVALVSCLAIAVIAPAVKVIRNMHSDTLMGALRESSPLDLVLEAGGSLRPLVETVEELDNRGGAYWYGKSYLMASAAVVPFARLADDPPNFWITSISAPGAYERGGSIGYSGIAEPYLNFGVIGVVLYFLALGAVLNGAEAVYRYNFYVYAILMSGVANLFWTTRNDSTNLLKPIMWATFIVGCIYCLHSIRRSAPLRQRART